jgi:hypothetical protein
VIGGGSGLRYNPAMLELMIETWTSPTGTSYRWSVWDNGTRVAMTERPHRQIAESEAEGLEYCTTGLKRRPDKITRL